MRRFTHTFPQRISAFLLCLALLVGLLPATAMAAEEDESSKAIMLGTNGIESPTGTEATGGQYYTPNSYIYFGSYNGTPIKWRVLDAETANDGSTDGMFLLSEYLLGTTQFASSSNAWQGSTAQNWCNNFAGDTENFSTTEQAAMLEITKTDNTTQLYSLSWGESSLDAETLFFLSAEELANYVGNYDGAPGLVATYAENGSAGAWWLRSPYAYISSYAGFVTDNGTVSSLGVDYDWAARPAFNLDLNSVLFTSAAEGGKSSGAVGADALQPVSEYAGNEWKLTLLDDEHKDFEISNTTINGDGDTFPSLCDYSTGEVSLDEETVVATLSQYMELLSSLDQKSIEADGGVWPNFLSADRPLSTLFLSDDLFFYLDIAYAQYQDLVAVPFAAQDGSIVANVSYYGAVSANCAAVEEAYEFLKLFLSREVQSGGALEADGASYDASEWGTTHGWPVRSDITAAELRAAVPQTPLLHGMVEELRQPVEGEPAPMLPEEFFTEAYDRIGEVRPYTQLDGSFSRAAMSLYDFTAYTPKTEEVENVAQDLLQQLETEVAE